MGIFSNKWCASHDNCKMLGRSKAVSCTRNDEKLLTFNEQSNFEWKITIWKQAENSPALQRCQIFERIRKCATLTDKLVHLVSFFLFGLETTINDDVIAENGSKAFNENGDTTFQALFKNLTHFNPNANSWM